MVVKDLDFEIRFQKLVFAIASANDSPVRSNHLVIVSRYVNSVVKPAVLGKVASILATLEDDSGVAVRVRMRQLVVLSLIEIVLNGFLTSVVVDTGGLY